MQKLSLISIVTLLILGIAASVLVLHNPFGTSQHISSQLPNNLPTANQTISSSTTTVSNTGTNSTQPSLLSNTPPSSTQSGGGDDGGSDS